MLPDDILENINKIIKKYDNTWFKSAYSHSIAVINELKGLLQTDFNQESLETFFIEKYRAKKYGQPISVLDDLAGLLNKIHNFNTVELAICSVIDINSEDIISDKTLGVYRILSARYQEMSPVENAIMPAAVGNRLLQ